MRFLALALLLATPARADICTDIGNEAVAIMEARQGGVDLLSILSLAHVSYQAAPLYSLIIAIVVDAYHSPVFPPEQATKLVADFGDMNRRLCLSKQGVPA